MSKSYIYARISKDDLNADNQVHALRERFPDALVETEVISGAAKEKPVLAALLARLRRNDVLAVYALDRLGRTGGEAITLVKGLLERGVRVYSHRENFEFDTAIGQFMSGQMLLFAQLERNLISERTKAALNRIKANGKKLGPPRKFPDDVVASIQGYRREGLAIRQIQERMKSGGTRISTGRICQILKASS